MEESQLLPNAPMMSAPIPELALPISVKYAGFWRRFVAYLIDAILINIVVGTFAVLFVGGAVMRFGTHFSSMGRNHNNFDASDQAALVGIIMSYVAFAGVSVLITWIYHALMESSSKQATIGKMAIGMVVTDLNGQRISFARATGRFFGKFVSSIILGIGYIMAGFTEKKQALHDMIAGTLVVLK